ncbi:hypothetical protein BDZ97DRAFT_800037 [Flammula alnicola]|nr:hypothetical protein BDZ97DRAFT_800037 [Flammula alnicola]
MISHKDISNSETYKNLLDERNLLLERARTIAEQCNTLVPIAKLPPEILLRIFIIKASSHDKAQNFIESSRQIDLSRDARRVGQVCRYWRQLALESPTLWNILLNCDSTPPQWAAELVRRSGTLPLKVTVNFHSSKHIRRSTTNFRMALPHFHRLGELEAFCGDVKRMPEVFSNGYDTRCRCFAALNCLKTMIQKRGTTRTTRSPTRRMLQWTR